MTDTTPTQQDREALAQLAVPLIPLSPMTCLAVADAILASDWLAEHVRAKQAEAYNRGAKAVERGNPYEGSGS